jgi:hypothetical protein
MALYQLDCVRFAVLVSALFTIAPAHAQGLAPASTTQVLPLGPTVFDAGVNRDGKKTYIVHGYSRVNHAHTGSGTQLYTGKISPALSGLVIDHAQASLAITGVSGLGTAAAYEFREVKPQINGAGSVDINYTLAITGRASITQLHYTIHIGSKETSPWPSPPPNPLHVEAACLPKPQHGHWAIDFKYAFEEPPSVTLNVYYPGRVEAAPDLRIELVEVSKTRFVFRTDLGSGEIGGHYFCYIATPTHTPGNSHGLTEQEFTSTFQGTR